MLWFESWLPSHVVRSPDSIFPRMGKRPHSGRLGWPAPVSGQQLPAILSFGRGFRAPVSARYFLISVSREGRLVRLFPETGSGKPVKGAKVTPVKGAKVTRGLQPRSALLSNANSRREILIAVLPPFSRRRIRTSGDRQADNSAGDSVEKSLGLARRGKSQAIAPQEMAAATNVAQSSAPARPTNRAGLWRGR
jgi:hypothetical protein